MSTDRDGQPALVTIVIPTYNDDPEHLTEAVASARAQTYPAIEVVVVNDGSTRAATVDALASLDGVRVVHQKNTGPGGARNAGIEVSQGELILPLDADDWIESDVIDLLVHALDSPNIVGAFPSVRRFGAAEGLQGAPPAIGLGDIAVNNHVVATALYRRDTWVQVGGYRETDTVDEDWFMWLKILGHTRGTMIQVPEAVLHYRLRPGSRSNTSQAAPGHIQRTIIDAMPELAGELYVAAAIEAQALKREVLELRAFHRAWAPRVAPVLRIRDLLRRLRRRHMP